MSTAPIPVKVTILDKEYRIACPPDEEEALLASAKYLNKRMKEINYSGKVVGVDKVAVMAALNITHELLLHQAEFDNLGKGATQRVRKLQERISVFLDEDRQLEP